MERNFINFIVFVLVFILAYLGMHFYVFFRLSSLLAFKKNIWFYIAMAVLTLSFPLASILERTIDGQIVKIIYTISSVWMGAVTLLLFSLLLFELVNLFFRIDYKITGIIIIAAVALLTVYSVINALFITVKYVEIPMNVGKEITIVQLSDIHLGTIHNSEYLKKIVHRTNSLNPDIVMITGDLVDSSTLLNEELVSPLNQIGAKTFFSTGNHEQYEGVDRVVSLLNKTSVTVLRDKMVVYDGIQIIGIDNPSDLSNKSAFLENLQINKSMPSVLMYHYPNDLKSANKAGINLQLSGHTHNGQIFPFNFIVMIFYPKMKGLYEYNGTYLYVSPGTSTWGPPMRLGSRNEITVIKLNNSSKK